MNANMIAGNANSANNAGTSGIGNAAGCGNPTNNVGNVGGMRDDAGIEGNALGTMAGWFDACRSLLASSHALSSPSKGRRARRFHRWLQGGADGRACFLEALSYVPACEIMPFANALNALDASFHRKADGNGGFFFTNGDGNDASQFVFMYAMNALRLAVTSSHAKWMERMGVPRALLVSFLDADRNMGDRDGLDGMMEVHASDDYSDAMHVIGFLAGNGGSVMAMHCKLKSLLRAACHVNLSELDGLQLTMLVNCKGKDDAIRTAGMMAGWHPSQRTLEILRNAGKDETNPRFYYSLFPVSIQMPIMETEPDGEAFGKAWACIRRFMEMSEDGVLIDGGSVFSSDRMFKAIMDESIIHAVHERDYSEANAVIAIVSIIAGIAKTSFRRETDGSDTAPSPLKALVAFDDETLEYVVKGYPIEFVNETLLAKTLDLKDMKRRFLQVFPDPYADCF